MKVEVLGADEVRAALRKLGAELPKALADGLNRTALAVERREKVAMSKSLDRPTPFTLNSIRRFKAFPNRLQAGLFVMDRQAGYLRPTIEGAELRDSIVPVLSNIRLDRHGNIRGKHGGLDKIAGTAQKKFVAKINGTVGVWQRYGPKGRKLRLLAFVAKQTPRAKRWDFYGVAEQTVRERLPRDMRDAIDGALRAFQ